MRERESEMRFCQLRENLNANYHRVLFLRQFSSRSCSPSVSSAHRALILALLRTLPVFICDLFQRMLDERGVECQGCVVRQPAKRKRVLCCITSKASSACKWLQKATERVMPGKHRASRVTGH